ncbi:hypothetical protein GobsT_36450 [Gemmata obscuriglobus]|uniref:Uncharacterized protein n=1 Tax=Gemmata obscuriglobus TaxID=114 RepID=A0A2Z3GXV9_9BACT|nr:hypothetical protein [Gemmata obscuriglobus]AWM38238.1 hypothetical protein C1280_15415 [Gemmata obscuriglobus]QEG28857.1 hypothetical protein GobsT_36450 [Gemmata obscuriglobus]VTS07285.1 unnamed protein product [Gemmata obscuriglobus UQM 2246]
MRHYRLNSLHERNGRLYLREEPFSGVAYEVIGDQVVANYLVSDGVRGGPAADWTSDRPRVLYQAIVPVTPDEIDDQHPEVGEYFGGALFDGVSYLFDEDTGMLLEETDFDPDKGPSRA